MFHQPSPRAQIRDKEYSKYQNYKFPYGETFANTSQLCSKKTHEVAGLQRIQQEYFSKSGKLFALFRRGRGGNMGSQQSFITDYAPYKTKGKGATPTATIKSTLYSLCRCYQNGRERDQGGWAAVLFFNESLASTFDAHYAMGFFITTHLLDFRNFDVANINIAKLCEF